jgi:sulfite reductase alpha subunit-like flavoprotein
VCLMLMQLEGDGTEASEEHKLAQAAAEITAEVNRVDENKVITVIFGSESPGKNAKFIAEDLCAKIRKSGMHVDGGGPIPLDAMMVHDRLTKAGGEARKKLVVVVSTAGVGEFPDGSKGFAKEAFGPKIEKRCASRPLEQCW